MEFQLNDRVRSEVYGEGIIIVVGYNDEDYAPDSDYSEGNTAFLVEFERESRYLHNGPDQQGNPQGRPQRCWWYDPTEMWGDPVDDLTNLTKRVRVKKGFALFMEKLDTTPEI